MSSPVLPVQRTVVFAGGVIGGLHILRAKAGPSMRPVHLFRRHVMHGDRDAEHTGKGDKVGPHMAVDGHAVVCAPISHHPVNITERALSSQARGEPGGGPGPIGAHINGAVDVVRQVGSPALGDLQHRADAVHDVVAQHGDGHLGPIRRILKLLPAKRQTLFFSATMPPEIETLANSMLTDPEKVEVTPASSTVDTIAQHVYFVEKKEKKDLLLHLLKDKSVESVLIFTRTKYGADKLARTLTKAGIRAEAIHGNKSQNARQRALTEFKSHTLRVLIATDIAARGIDVDQLSHVINYELPNVPETYVHRIGRTGRAGHEGIAISFCESEEIPYLKDIQKLIGKTIPVVSEHPFITNEGMKAQEVKTEEIKAKAKENKVYRGSRSNGDFWRRKKQVPKREQKK